MTDDEFIGTMMRGEKAGYCWRCSTSGHVLKYDPMGDRARDNRLTGLCSHCAGERRQLGERYRRLGRRLIPNRTVEPIV